MDLPSQFDRLPPHSIEAEKCFLGSCMLLTDAVERREARTLVDEDDFYQADHSIIFRVFAKNVDRDRPIDAVIMREELGQIGLLEEVGGTAYLGEILNGVPSAAHFRHYANLIRTKSLQRKTISVANDLLRRMYEPIEADILPEVIRKGGESLFGAIHAQSDIRVYSMPEMTEAFVDDKEAKKSPSQLIGIEQLDKYPGIICYGQQTVIAGRPSMGKSVFTRFILGELAAAGTPCGLISIEETIRKIAGNYLSAASEIENDVLAYSELSSNQWQRVQNARADINGWPLYVVDNVVSIMDVLAAYEMLVYKYKCRVVAVDHLHLISNRTAKFDTGEAKVSDSSERLKHVCKKTNTAELLVAQLSRPSDKTKLIPPKPTLADLRQSGAIEQNADAAVLLHRDEYYTKPRIEDFTGATDIIIAKNRNGKTGIERMIMSSQFQKFIIGAAGTQVEMPW